MRRLQRAADVLAGGMALASGAAFLLLAAYLVVDVSARYFLGVSTAAADELSGYALGAGGMFALAHALRAGAHVRIDVLLPHLPGRIRAALDHAAMTLMAAFASTLAVALWGLAIDSYQIDARALSHLRTPLVLPQALMALGVTMLGLQAVLLVLGAALESVRARRLVSPAGADSREARAKDAGL